MEFTPVVKRPSVDRSIKVRTNFFELLSMPTNNIIHYDVSITPEVPPRFNMKIFESFVEKYRESLGNAKPVFDDSTNLSDNYKKGWKRYCYGGTGRSFFTQKESSPIAGGVEVWRGYYQSARPTRGKMMINIDLSATVFYQDGPLIQLITKILKLGSLDKLRSGLSERDHQMVERTIKNLKIRVNHRAETRTSSFKIEKLTQTPASSTMFEKDGNTINVGTYFQNTYNKRLIYPFLPCVVVRRHILLPLEVCDVIPGQRYMRKLNGGQMDEMMALTRQNPSIRTNMIRKGVKILNDQTEFMQQFGVKVSDKMAVVDARVLPAPTIIYHPSSREKHITPINGNWNLRNKKLAIGATLGSWCVLAFLSSDVFPDNVISTFVRELATVCQDTGMNVPNKNPPILHANPQGNIEESLKQAWLKAGNSAKAQPQLILCILPNTGQPLYAEIKRVSDTVIGVATQCVQIKHTRKTKKQYCANVCLKINVKLGGMNSSLSPEQISFISDRPTILMGADVTHPAPGSGNERPSIAAVTASVDSKASRYAASIRIQRGRTEIIADLGNMVKELLKAFYQTCGRKPERILFYRDGVSESQFENVKAIEVEAIKTACHALDNKYNPTITFIVVQKRHHTRIFPIDGGDTDASGNCLPGTVINTVITHPNEFDFYLQSHAGLLGTSRPAHYRVLYDENGFNQDALQTLSYNLCYLYARCTRSISLVPPVYYAHLVTKRAKLHARGGSFSDTESEESAGGAAVAFGEVKPVLQRVMYFM
ncbi:Piwi domain-containing protein [Rhizophagus irregularis DAOM 181602=DAOM 197198]|nr:Piwi domain-containing protein [Rhizophagus irregularis DAOM 181602=DAOM 197198]